MARITVTYLREWIDKTNEKLAEHGIRNRLECGGRNGYQAIDEYSVDENGERIGSGVNRNIQCGTSRECVQAAELYYWQQVAGKGKEEWY